MTQLASSMVCGGCGTVVGDLEPYPFRCPRAGDGGDHVLRRVLEVKELEFSLEVNESQSLRPLAGPHSLVPLGVGLWHERPDLRRARPCP